ncbi:MAG: choice-of-anchor B family protein [Gemmatimonadota bacterium]|nr:choice-of-anchor B family protein [Gemmatimonadota bacterium]
MHTRLAGLYVSIAVGLLVSPPSGVAGQTTAGSIPSPTVATAFSASVVVQGDEIFVARPGGLAIFPMPGNRAGGVHIFTRAGDGWTETASLPTPVTDAATGFGEGLDVSGDVLVVGAPGEGTGAVYVYRREGDGWSRIQRLAWGEAPADARFGAAVATNGSDILVGAPGADEGRGAVFGFRAYGVGYSPSGALQPADLPDGAGYGTSLDLEDDLLAVGAPGGAISLIPGTGVPDLQPGSVYLFGGATGTWTPLIRLEPPELVPASMGASVAVSRGEVFAGAPLGGQLSGAVYHFTPAGGGAGTEWTHAHTIQPGTPVAASGFGMAVAASGDDLVAGTPLAGGGLGGGYAFRRDESGDWAEVAEFGSGGPFNFYGLSVALGGDVAVVGAPGADFFDGVGFLFGRTPDGWRSEGRIVDEGGEIEALTGGEIGCDGGSAGGFACGEVDLVAFVPTHDLGGQRGAVANDLWGWTDSETGREYAIMGRSDATTFVDLTDPSNPVYLGELPLTEGATPNMWRDIKVYSDHAFVVADNAGAHGVQVFDLTRLRNVSDPPMTFEPTARYDGIHSAHNIVINEETGFAYVVGASGGGETCGGGLHMVDIRDPQNPTFAGCFADAATGNMGTGYSHDAQCVRYRGPDEQYRDREICLGANENALSISDVTDKEEPVALSSATYPNSGYLHQGWLSDDHRYFYMNDETDELAGNVSRTRTLIWDISELDDPVLVKEHLGTTGSSDHNLYVLGDYMYQANYLSGLRILDISNPEEPREVGFFDTVPFGEDKAGFAGAWSVYPYFKSGVIIVSSIKEGLFVLKKRPPAVS